MNYVQAFIDNISFPTTLEELEIYGSRFNMEEILGIMNEYDLENDLKCETEGWTVPRWAKIDDIVFFYHAKTANSRISRLVTELNRNKDDYCETDYWFMMNSLSRAKSIWSNYGGKIFAIGRVAGAPYSEEDYQETKLHWSSNIYAAIDHIFVLENPIDISEFNDKITVSRQSSITSVVGEDFVYLKGLIIKKNKYVWDYFIQSVAQPLPLSKVTSENWLSVTNPYRRSFFLEAQFRAYYVDHLLPLIGDRKKIYRECVCMKQGCSLTRVDNVIHLQGKYFPVEVKLNVSIERDLKDQLEQYLNVDSVSLAKDITVIGKEMLNTIMVIDTEAIYLFKDNTLRPIYYLDNLQNANDVNDLKKLLRKLATG